MTLTIKIDVPGKVEAYQLVSKLALRTGKVISAKLGTAPEYVFDSKVEEKKPKYFLREDFGKPELLTRIGKRE